MLEVRDYYTGGLKSSVYSKAFGIDPNLIAPEKKERAEKIFQAEKKMEDDRKLEA